MSQTLRRSFLCRKNFSLVAGIFFSASLFSQDSNSWIQQWQNGTNFYSIKAAFDSAWAGKEQDILNDRNKIHKKDKEREELDGTYFQFKRWEWFMQPRVDASGNIAQAGMTYKNFMDYLHANPAAMAQYQRSVARTATSNSWSFLGPTGAPYNSGAGRLNCVRFDPTNTNIIYVGAPAGGLWKSVNSGASWTNLTDFLPTIGCSDVAIDPTNTNILYLATGDRDAGDSPSIGVMKSTDGGITWNMTGLNWSVMQGKQVNRLLIDPTNPNILFAGTSNGIYKTTDAAASWALVASLNSKTMEFKPGDPNTIYSCGLWFSVSTNGGANWTTATGLPSSSQVSRLALAVTPADPNYVYVLASKSNDNGFKGVYRSTDGGFSFTTQSTSPNLLGWAPDASDSGGQGWYTLSIAVAPYDRDVVIIGGVNIWRSDDGGVNWWLNAHWYGGGGAPYVHADIHDLRFVPGTTGHYIAACDGGIFQTLTDGGSFADLSNNLCIAQIYRIGLSASDPGTFITGHQDNGTNIHTTAGGYFSGLGGDGMMCFIDRTNDNTMFGEYYNGTFNKTTNGGANWNGITSGITGNAAWVTPWCQDPVQANVLYGGYEQVFKSTNQGNTWNQLGTLPAMGTLSDIAVAPSNPQYIYVTNGSTLGRTTDGGNNWTTVPLTGFTGGSGISRVTVCPYDEKKLWISCSGFNDNDKVFLSTDGGTSWSNISNGLPNIPANCIVAVPGSMSDALFVGCEAGVYYHDNSMTTWQPYFTALPNVPIDDLNIFAPTMMLRAATYGRGVWECAIDQSVLTPLADFSADTTVVCPGQTVHFTDLSAQNPTAWNWSFPGGNPSSSTMQNPAVTYSTPGVYPVTLVATNAAGNATRVRTAYITVSGANQPPFFEGFATQNFLPSGWTMLNAGNLNYYWQRSGTTGHNSSESAFFDNFNQNVAPDRDEMRSPGINFTGYTSLSLQFDVAYARYSASRSDTLEVLLSADCGNTWVTAYTKGGTTLATAGTLTTAFTPTNNQWRTETVNINAWAGQGDVLVAFRNRGHHGNFLWIDNINITGTVNAAPVANYNVSSAMCMNDSIHFTDISAPAATSWHWYFPGGSPSTSALQNPAAVYPVAGTYTVSLVSTNAFGSDSTAQVITVNTSPVADAGNDSAFCSGTTAQLNGSGGILYSWSPPTGLSNPLNAITGVSLSASQTFSLTVTDINGCSATDSVHLTVHPIPTFSVSRTPTSICRGDTTTLVGSDSLLTYAWNPSVIQITSDSFISIPQFTTTYTVTATDSLGCTGTAYPSVTVFPVVLQPVVYAQGWYLICSVSAYSYQWFFNGNPIVGATSQTYTASQTGMYSVEAYTSHGCASGAATAVFVNGIPGYELSSLSVLPNPNSGTFDISFSSAAAKDYTISIFCADGRVAYSEKLAHFSGTYSQHIDLGNFGAGIYFVRIADEKDETVRRIVVY